MTLRRAITSILHLLIVFTYLGAGLLCISLAYLPEWQVRLADLVLHQADLFVQVGLGLLGAAFFLLLVFYGLNRGRFVRFTMGRHVVELKETIIRHTIEAFFKKQHPNLTLVDLEIIGKSNIELRVSVDRRMEPEKVELLLEQVEIQLAELFYDRFGYKKSFTLSIKSSSL